ncbi:MAG: type II toxin-antitoxin system HipA family toxin [Mycoplasma sp.]
MNTNIKTLKVKYNNIDVGILKELEDKRIAFQYYDKWIKNGFSISPISLPLSDKVYISKSNNFNGLYGVFNDSLPDGFGTLVLISKLKKDGINFHKLSQLTKLSIINENGLGGLTYEPVQAKEYLYGNLDLDKLAVQALKIYENDEGIFELEEVYNLSTASGGARPKAHIKIDDEFWIVKFPCSADPKDISTQEDNLNKFSVECGIRTNEFKLFESTSGKKYFGAKRFDRMPNHREHVISLSSLFETTHLIPNLDYNHLFQVTKIICNANEMYEVFKRMTFNVLIKNKDDHGKNISFIYDNEIKKYKLSPAYDITSTPNSLEHQMTVNGIGNPTEKDLLKLADKFDLDLNKCNSILSNMKSILKNAQI